MRVLERGRRLAGVRTTRSRRGERRCGRVRDAELEVWWSAERRLGEELRRSRNEFMVGGRLLWKYGYYGDVRPWLVHRCWGCGSGIPDRHPSSCKASGITVASRRYKAESRAFSLWKTTRNNNAHQIFLSAHDFDSASGFMEQSSHSYPVS